MKRNACIYIAGHQGLVGSAIVRRLQREGYHNLLKKSYRCVKGVNFFLNLFFSLDIFSLNVVLDIPEVLSK